MMDVKEAREMDFFEILEAVMVPNRDDGRRFTCTERIERIDGLLWNSKYRRVDPDGLYLLYAAKPLEQIERPVVLSSHIDCVPAMTRLFSEEAGEGLIRGTYDNGITNAAVLALMLDGRLPDNVLVAFTGDEERDSNGAVQLMRRLTERGKRPSMVAVLDVTDMGWTEGADFTVENNFWTDDQGRTVIAAAMQTAGSWRFVPEDEDEIPDYVPRELVIRQEAEPDESWDYDEQGQVCFSLCLPVWGPMHSSRGVLARKSGCLAYLEALERIAGALAGMA